ncbi:F420H(2)-dependent quinone reductase [Mycolicibacterium vanbaalenii]|uniref:F420H(2)-dependent quinone reductase n=2 Tax=Mycolicibacterium vanbaalenii TaxID=110539 RepID=A0A5S9R868_MYCVN|nr:F420H(2)-dependent quinone reductase [Mycolicibacterium vanbaalenii]
MNDNVYQKWAPTPVPRARELQARVMALPLFRRMAPKVFPRLHRWSYRLSKGRVTFAGRTAPVILVLVTGARTGTKRPVPLAAVPQGAGKWLVVGSNFGRPGHPAWTTNILAHPQVEITAGTTTYSAMARLLEGDERAKTWPELIWWFPIWAKYTDVTDRPFRVFCLEPVAGTS